MIIIDPFKKYYKKELIDNGYKLAFLDTSVLIGNDNNPLKPRLSKKIVDDLRKHKIRPVVNDFTLSEFIKGLDNKHPQYKDHYSNKIEVMKCLDELECLFLLPHEEIESMELKYAHDHLNELDKNTHDFLEVFRYCPVNTNYTALTKYTYEEYLAQLINRMGKDISEQLKSGLKENVECADLLREIFKDFCDKDKTLLRKTLHRNFVVTRLNAYDNIDAHNITKLVDILNCIGLQS